MQYASPVLPPLPGRLVPAAVNTERSHPPNHLSRCEPWVYQLVTSKPPPFWLPPCNKAAVAGAIAVATNNSDNSPATRARNLACQAGCLGIAGALRPGLVGVGTRWW